VNPDHASIVTKNSADAEPPPSLAETLKALSDLWTTTIVPFIDAVRTAVNKLHERDEATVKAVDEFLDGLPCIANAIVIQAVRAESRINQTLAGAELLGRLGWTLTLKMTSRQMRALCELSTIDEVDLAMLTWYERHDADLSDLERRIFKGSHLDEFRIVLSQCFTAYRRGDYAVTIYCLVAVLERSIRILVPDKDFYSSKMKALVEELCERVKADSPTSLDLFVLLSVYSFVCWLYEQYGPHNSTSARMFRHGIQHGTQSPRNNKVDALRLVHALDTVMSLYQPDTTWDRL
jgi:hypothetical protein